MQRKSMHTTTMNAPVVLSSILLADDDGQVYAKVIRALGNRRFECRCSDNQTRTVVIRGTFRKRKKHVHRDTFVKVGMWVLVSVREGLNKGEKGDIIHMYSDSEVAVLKRYHMIRDMDDRPSMDDEDIVFTDAYDDTVAGNTEVSTSIEPTREACTQDTSQDTSSVWYNEDEPQTGVYPIYCKKELETIDWSLI